MTTSFASLVVGCNLSLPSRRRQTTSNGLSPIAMPPSAFIQRPSSTSSLGRTRNLSEFCTNICFGTQSRCKSLFSLPALLHRFHVESGRDVDSGKQFIDGWHVSTQICLPRSSKQENRQNHKLFGGNSMSAIRFQHPLPQTECRRCPNFSARLYQIAFGRPAVADQARRQRHPKNFRARQDILISQLEHASTVEMLDLSHAFCSEISVFRAWHFQDEQLELMAAQPQFVCCHNRTFHLRVAPVIQLDSVLGEICNVPFPLSMLVSAQSRIILPHHHGHHMQLQVIAKYLPTSSPSILS